MSADLDTLAGGASGATEPQPEPDYASLLDDSDGLDIPEPNEDAADANADEPENEGDAQKADGPGAIADDAKLQLDGRDVTVAELKETFTTFQRKTQEYAEADQQREVQARTAIAHTHERAAQQIAVIVQGISDLVLPGIDMQAIARMRLEDPARAGEMLSSLQIVERWKTDMLAKGGEMWKQAQTQRQAADAKTASSRDELQASEAQKLQPEKWFTDDFRTKARSFLKNHGVPENYAGEIPYAGMVKVVRMAMEYERGMAKLKAGKQPSQTAQAPASGRAPAASTKQQSDGLFAQARKSGDRRTTARAYSSLLG